MSISIFRKIPIYYAAKKDSKGAYSSYLEEWHTRIDVSAEFRLSTFMSRLVISYSQKCEWKLSHTGCFQRLYTQILGLCNILDEQLKQRDDQIKILQDKIKEVDDKIQERQQKLTRLKADWTCAYNTGNLPNGSDVSTVRELRTVMDKIGPEIQGLTAESGELREKLQTAQNALSMDTQKAFAQLEKLTLSYQNKINRLYGELMAFANRQDEYFVWYWHKLCERLNKRSRFVIYDQPKSFRQICQLRDVHLIEKEELFPKERAEINRRTGYYKNFPISV